MANEQNLRPFTSEQSREEAKKNGKKGGIASGEARRRRKTFRETLLALLEDGDLQENINLAILQKAKKGDIKAFEVVRDTIGEKPTEKIEAEVTNTNINITLEEEDQSDE